MSMALRPGTPAAGAQAMRSPQGAGGEVDAQGRWLSMLCRAGCDDKVCDKTMIKTGSRQEIHVPKVVTIGK